MAPQSMSTGWSPFRNCFVGINFVSNKSGSVFQKVLLRSHFGSIFSVLHSNPCNRIESLLIRKPNVWDHYTPTPNSFSFKITISIYIVAETCLVASQNTQRLSPFTMQGKQAYSKFKAPIETGLQTTWLCVIPY